MATHLVPSVKRVQLSGTGALKIFSVSTFITIIIIIIAISL